MITTHYDNSRDEVQADKDHPLEELDPTEEEAEIYDTCTPLDYSDQCRVEETRGLNYLLEKKQTRLAQTLFTNLSPLCPIAR